MELKLELEEPSVSFSFKRKAGRKKFKETRHPIYRGVRERNGGKWVSEIREPGNKHRRIWLGTFATPVMAARAYDVAAIALRGETAEVNFRDSRWALPRARSRSPEEIRKAAVEAAGMVEREGEGGEVVDEEEVFNMPGLVEGMAEGMMLTPPAMKRGFDWDGEWSGNLDLSLWTL